MIVLLASSCIRSSRVQEKKVSATCCLDSISYIPNDSLLTPAFVKMRFANCDPTLIESIESVVFPEIPVKNTLFYDFGLWRVEQISPNTAVVVLDTYYFTDSDLAKDSIEHLLLKRVGLITKHNDTVYVEQCTREQ